MNKIKIIFFFTILISCKENSKSYNDNSIESPFENIVANKDATNYHEISDEYSDGTYCAVVEYFNPSTGTRNTYNLDVEVEGGELTVIHWPNSGWLDDSHFSPEDITDGECEFTSDRGYRYTVTLGELGGCGYTDAYKIRRDVNNEVEETTCPKCGYEKDSYDDICVDCKRKIEQTCPKCGGYKFSGIDDYCDDCIDELANNEE
jgi:hypothetical protein